MQAELNWLTRNFAYKCNSMDSTRNISSVPFHTEGDEDVQWTLTLWPAEKEDNNVWVS